MLTLLTFRLLDGRLNQLTSFLVQFYLMENDSSIISNTVLNLKCFSLIYDGLIDGSYDEICSLLQRMISLQELTLYLRIGYQGVFLHPIDLINQFSTYSSQLRLFNFYVSAENHHEHLLSYLNKGEMKQTFLNRKYKQILNILPTRVNRSTYHVFTLPFQFVKLMLIGSELPDIKFDCVTELSIEEVVPFQNKFFVRISKCFPMLKHFSVSNSSSILSNQTTADENIPRDSIIKYPHLI